MTRGLDRTNAPRRVAVVGCGGLGRETLEALRAGPDAQPAVGFLDEDASRHGRSVAGLPVLGGPDWLVKHPDASFVVAIGAPAVVERIASLPELAGRAAAPVVHPSAVVGSTCAIGEGTIVLPGATMTADVVVGKHVVVNPLCSLAHDVVIEDFAQLTPGVALSGNVRVGRGAYVGTGACVKQGVTIGARAIVGAGAVVLRDVPPGATVVGNPARVLRE